MELADRIVAASMKLFFERGIKAVSMDDVAKSVGISKRTLYETFESKDTLLMACVDDMAEAHRRQMDDYIGRDMSFMEFMLRCTYDAISFLHKINPVFFSDLTRYNYVNVKLKFDDDIALYRQRMADMIERSKRDGHMREDVDSELVAMLILGNKRGGLQEVVESGRWTLQEVMRNLVAIFLRGMATESGIRVIDDVLGRIVSLETQKETKNKR